MSLKYFTLEEFDCQETGDNRMEMDFLVKLDALRGACGFPFEITSGYRHPTLHPLEAKKEIPGSHAQGIAADIRIINSAHRHTLVRTALDMGFTGIGVADTFIHVDTRGSTPVMWTY